jgi:hypothetical protein
MNKFFLAVTVFVTMCFTIQKANAQEQIENLPSQKELYLNTHSNVNVINSECYKIKNETDRYGNKTGCIVYYNYCGETIEIIIQYQECESDWTGCELKQKRVTLYATDYDDKWHSLMLSDSLTKYNFIKIVR